MKKRALLGFLFLATLGVVVSSCSDSDDVDNEKPVISNFDPEEGEELQIGGKIHFEVDFTDNEKLASYKIDIHHNFDNHGEHKAAVEDAADSIKFSYTNTWTLEGLKNSHVHHHEIEIPESQVVDGVKKFIRPGKYHFVVYCMDAAGNQSVLSHNVILSKNATPHDHDED
ncbi:MAG: DUF4625 domain-containing protein [Dysgonomonas sp.]